MPTPIIHTQPNEHIVAMFSTHHLYNVLPATVNSLIAYNPDVHLFVFIEHDDPPFTAPDNVTFINVSGQGLFPADGPNYSTKYTYMILLKAAMTKIFPDADRLVVMDVDTITYGSISDMWKYDLSHAYYAAVTEPNGSKLRGIPYPNFGFVLLNLQRLRSSGKDIDIINLLNSRRFSYPEQDAFAQICGNRFDPLPADYNDTQCGFNITGMPSKTIVRHFAGFNSDTWKCFDIAQYWLTHTTPPPKYVVYAADHRVQDMMLASAKSLLHHTSVDKIFLLVDNDHIGTDLPPVFHPINVSSQTIFPVNGPNILPWYGYMTTLRAGLTKILPSDIDTVLWLDPDTVVVDDISDLWNAEITNHYFAAVEEVRNHNHTLKPYFNAGVMLMNLKKFRTDAKDIEVINDINSTKYEHLEQDALNYNCFCHIRKLPSKYSDSYVSEPCTSPCIKHFLAQAKNGFTPAVQPYNIPWNKLKGVIEYDQKE